MKEGGTMNRQSILSLDENTKQLLAKLKNLLRQRAPQAELMLYGSAARGTREPESDYDLLVLLDKPLAKKEMAAIQESVYNLELEHEVVISLAFYTVDEWNRPISRVSPFHQAVEKEAIRL